MITEFFEQPLVPEEAMGKQRVPPDDDGIRAGTTPTCLLLHNFFQEKRLNASILQVVQTLLCNVFLWFHLFAFRQQCTGSL